MEFKGAADDPPVRVTIRDGVCTLTLNRAKNRNALSNEMRDALLESLERCSADCSIGAVVLTGDGTAFCAGGDLKRDAAAAPPTPQQRLASLEALHRLPLLLARLPHVTIAAVNGPAFGAGLSLAAACDFRIASVDARFASQFLNVGLASDCGASWTLTRVVGPARARELLLVPDAFDAAHALAIGLVTRVVDGAQLQEQAHAFASRFAQGPRTAQALMKANLDEAQRVDLEAALAFEARNQVQALLAPDHAEAVRAFMAKRKPTFQS